VIQGEGERELSRRQRRAIQGEGKKGLSRRQRKAIQGEVERERWRCVREREIEKLMIKIEGKRTYL